MRFFKSDTSSACTVAVPRMRLMAPARVVRRAVSVRRDAKYIAAPMLLCDASALWRACEHGRKLAVIDQSRDGYIAVIDDGRMVELQDLWTDMYLWTRIRSGMRVPNPVTRGHF